MQLPRQTHMGAQPDHESTATDVAALLSDETKLLNLAAAVGLIQALRLHLRVVSAPLLHRQDPLEVPNFQGFLLQRDQLN